ncbi:MAG: trigger factor [Lentisphaerae bacterium RIFOXYC12_FULL_60_16]|nr:MAG: trigger factor [Lentisphaerae bacterium RIFOXYC12_FULL_60_16]
MKIKVDKAGPCRQKLMVEASVEETRGTYDQTLKDISRVAEIRGFRKGKAPVPMVEKRLSKEIIEETRDRLVPHLYREALAKEGIHPISIIQVEGVKYAPDQGVSFAVTVDVPPDFKLPKYEKIRVKRNAVEVSDADVEQHLKQLLERRSRFEDTERKTIQAEDLVRVDYTGTCDGAAVGSTAPDCAGLGEGKDVWVFLGGQDFLPGFNQALIGGSVEQAVDVPVNFPADFHVASMAGKKALYHVTIRQIRQRVPPEMNEEFFKAFGTDSLDGVKALIRKELETSAQATESARLKEAVAGELLNQTTFDLPQSVVDEEVRTAIRGIVQENTMRGVPQAEIEARKDDILQSAVKTSEERVRLSYILSRIADELKVEVTEEAMDRRLARLAVRYRMEPSALRDMMEKNNRLEEVRGDLRAEMTLDKLVSKAAGDVPEGA